MGDLTNDTNMIETCSSLSLIIKYRKLSESYLLKFQPCSALYWTSLCVTLSNDDLEDVLRLARCFFASKQYHRAAYCLTSRNLDKRDLRCCHLAAKAVFESHEFEEALNIINNAEQLISKAQKQIIEIRDEEDTTQQTLSSIYLLKGHIFESLDNRSQAASAYREALRLDISCHEAFDSLVNHQLLTASEERDLIDSLPEGESEDSFASHAKLLYVAGLKKYDQPNPSTLFLPKTIECLVNNPDIRVLLAERHYYNCDYDACYQITSSVLKNDRFHVECLPIHISCLVDLDRTNELFTLAHKLVDTYPEWAVSWFAVGLYYYSLGRHEPARRYLEKATQLNRIFGPAWLAFGHSFSIENEHDQAMAAYFKAFKLMKGCHLPLLYIGVEYSLTNNINLAEKFFLQALSIAPNDPFVLHEMGCVAYQTQKFIKAERHFLDALSYVERIVGSSSNFAFSSKWMPLLNNLGHVSRALGRYPEALAYHGRANLLNPVNAEIFSAMGFVKTLMGDLEGAINEFHKALAIKTEDIFSSTMLKNVLEQLIASTTYNGEICDDSCKLKMPDLSIIQRTSDSFSDGLNRISPVNAGPPEEMFSDSVSMEINSSNVDMMLDHSVSM